MSTRPSELGEVDDAWLAVTASRAPSDRTGAHVGVDELDSVGPTRREEIELPAPGDVALAVLLRDGCVLVQRRHRAALGFVHEFPGGAVDAGETWVGAAARELFEETGLEERAAARCIVRAGENGRRVGFAVFVSGSVEPPRMTNARRRQTFHWFVPGDIPLTDFLAADRQFITHDLPALLLSARGR